MKVFENSNSTTMTAQISCPNNHEGPPSSSLSSPSSPSRFNEKTLQDYEVLSVIGNGCFGTCFKVRDKMTGELYAWKGMDYGDLTGESQESLVSEINVLRQLQHSNIVQYYHHLINSESQTIYLIMEYCAGGDLAQLIRQARREHRRFEERYIWRVLFQLCRALQICHTRLEDGMILHRDIKPANIFLDDRGNAKLGDFGLARMLRRNERFAKSIVGTPYYMSPEIVSGSHYDRTSDVWALGCLIYEMCSLQPPFRGNVFEQLSTNIANGQFRQIPNVYSIDLQEIIAFMLAVAKDQRPGVEVITRHPIVVRNVNELGDQFPQLIEAETEFLQEHLIMESERQGREISCCQLKYSIEKDDDGCFSDNTILSPENSCNEHQQRRNNNDLSGVFTPDLRAELFYSKHKRTSIIHRQKSDPELYESIRRAHPKRTTSYDTPSLLTQAVFDRLLQERLLAIRTHESLLQRQAAGLADREQQLIAKQRHLLALEESLLARERTLETELRVLNAAQKALEIEHKLLEQRSIMVDTATSPLQPPPPPLIQRSKPIPPLPPPPPIPPRKTKANGNHGGNHDDTYCSIESTNESMLMPSTIAKLDMTILPAPKSMPPSAMRRVTFQSPKQFITYNIENQLPQGVKGSMTTKNDDSNDIGSTTVATSSSSSSMSSAASGTGGQRRARSLFSSLFGLHRLGGKETTQQQSARQNNIIAPAPVPVANAPQTSAPTSTSTMMKTQERIPTTTTTTTTFMPRPEEVLAKCDTADLTSIWTKENKRAAFDLLAAMNSNNTMTVRQTVTAPLGSGIENSHNNNNNSMGRHRFRHSARERHTLQRNRMRRSLVVTGNVIPDNASAPTAAASSSTHLSMLGSREQILV